MKVAFLMGAAASAAGGLETAAREFAAGAARLGHEVTLVTGTGPSARVLRGLTGAPYRIVTVPMIGRASAAVRLLARWRGVHPSVVESRLFWAAATHNRRAVDALESSAVVSAHFEVEAVAASRTLRAPVVYYYAGAMDPRRVARARFKRIVAISRMIAALHETLPSALGLAPIDAVVHPGVRAELIASGPAPGTLRDLPETIFTGRLDLTGEKRAAWLIELWPRVLEKAPRAQLTLIGGGPLLPELRRLTAKLSISQLVSLPGPLPHGMVAERLREAGLYVFPSRFETFGIAPLEALAAGLPVMASDLPALRESLGEAALFLPVDDEAAWVNAIEAYLTDRDLRLSMAVRGPLRAAELTWDRQAKAYEAELLAALSGPTAGGEAARLSTGMA